DVVHDDHARAVHDADAHRGVRARRKTLGVDERAPAQLVEVQVGVAELQQPGAELVLARVAVLLDEAVRLQRLQEPVHRRHRELEALRELGHAEAPWTAGERLENARGAVDRLDSPAPCRTCCIRHCRMTFDQVEYQRSQRGGETWSGSSSYHIARSSPPALPNSRRRWPAPRSRSSTRAARAT